MNHYFVLYHWTIYMPIHTHCENANENKCKQKVKRTVFRLKLKFMFKSYLNSWLFYMGGTYYNYAWRSALDDIEAIVEMPPLTDDITVGNNATLCQQ